MPPLAATASPRRCTRDRIRDVLVARILDGTYPAGTRLKELALAAEFRVSQAPVREALRELEALGLVTSERYRGTRVRAMDVDELREAYELRATIEVRSAELAVPCSAELLALLRGHVNEMREQLETGDRIAYIDAALRLHRALVQASGNRVFLSTWDSFNWEVRSRIVLRRLLVGGRDLRPFFNCYARLIRRLGEGDGRDAGEALREVFNLVHEAI